VRSPSPTYYGNGAAFAESKTFWWEPNLELSAKSSLPREKKISAGKTTLSKGILRREQKKNSRRRILWLSAKKIFVGSFFSLGKVIFKNSLFHLQTFIIINMYLYKGYVQIWRNFISVCYISKF
jgi:hypothetical protein